MEEQSASAESRPPLALHVRRHRRMGKERELTQRELADLVGISRSQLGTFERTRELPAGLRPFVDLALTLGVSLDDLVAPAAVARRWDVVRQRVASYGTTHANERTI